MVDVPERDQRSAKGRRERANEGVRGPGGPKSRRIRLESKRSGRLCPNGEGAVAGFRRLDGIDDAGRRGRLRPRSLLRPTPHCGARVNSDRARGACASRCSSARILPGPRAVEVGSAKRESFASKARYGRRGLLNAGRCSRAEQRVGEHRMPPTRPPGARHCVFNGTKSERPPNHSPVCLPSIATCDVVPLSPSDAPLNASARLLAPKRLYGSPVTPNAANPLSSLQAYGSDPE
jgi:hypothetical protein